MNAGMVIEREAWRDFTTEGGATNHHEQFEDFVRARPLEGLGATVEQIERICADDSCARLALQRVLKIGQGKRSDLVDNINEVRTRMPAKGTGVVRILRPPLCGDPAAQVPRDQWPLQVEERQRSCQAFLHTDCRLLLFFVKDGAENDWLGYSDRNSYLRDGLQLDPDLVEWALEGLRKVAPDEAQPFEQMVVLGKRGAPRGNRNAAKGGSGNNLRNTKFESDTRDYVGARLHRDRPELADQVVKGTLSAHAAAIQAGFRDRTISVSLNPEKAARTLKRHFTAEDWQRFLRAANEAQP